MATVGGALVSDVEDGGGGDGRSNDAPKRAAIDTRVPPGGIIPVDGWGETTDPRVLIAAVGFIAGSRAAVVDQRALENMA
ncbi:hypothetical protein [Nocardia stercoris]|uniref:Uncharacterized protein n=1 Tax=Nocardia stercoris TaxID=2483361 RepID=A0A3M2KY19_9NOCA|nr:hypothetical protein [Nocardia stercoris]RMI30382.1 hypothetical protein EBN03_22345 [Nocardia stercoris]